MKSLDLQNLDKKIEEALACPCVDDLREGPCGSQFTQAFTCYIKNVKADKVSWGLCCRSDVNFLPPYRVIDWLLCLEALQVLTVQTIIN